ncbi:testis-expressed protein 13D [Capricornis sumatraensis]|uniref:testis-expressed protein 13D n=1 Tax=Capricornis sumatraensis TaxID=34865 RepID=UPI0036048F1E
MAVNSGDYSSGFRHNDVISFINSEVLMNGGDPDFYMAFRSRPWNEVEDRLRVVIANPQVPHAIKRACAWSALALSVRLGMRQQEWQECQIRWLQEQVEKREETSWALASELQCVREEREEIVAQLRFTRASLQQVLKECDVLRGWLLQVPPLAQEMGPGPGAEQFGAVAQPMSVEQQVAMGLHGRPYFEAAAVYVPGPPNPWFQAMLPPMPMPRLYPFPYHAPLPMGSAFLPPVPPAEAEAAVVPFQMPSQGINLPGPLVEVGFQEKMAPPGNKKSYSQGEGHEILQGTVPLGDIRSLNQEEGQERSQEMVPLGDSWSHSQEEGPERPQGMIPLGTSGSHSQEEGQERSQEMVPFGDSWSHIQEEGPERLQGMIPQGTNGSHSQDEGQERSQEMVPLGDSWSHSQEEGPETPQGMIPLGISGSHSQEEGQEKSQEMVPLGGSRSHSQEEGPERSQWMIPLGTSGSQEEGQERSQEMVPLGDSWSHSQEEGTERPQQMIPLGTSGSHSQEEVPRRCQGTVPLGDNRNQNQERDLERFQRILPLEYNRNHKQEDPERPQGTDHLGVSRSQSQEGGPERPQATAQGDSWSHDGRENPKKQQPQGQKTEKPKGKKASELYHKEKSASGCSSVNWKCSWCKVIKFPWCKSCYKFRKVCRAVESGGPDSGQTH